MRKPILPRLAGILVVFCAIFVALSLVQFVKQDGFSRKIGDLLVVGKYPGSGNAQNVPESSMSGEIQVQDPVTVFFGGMEFRIGSGENDDTGLAFVDSNGVRHPLFPESMSLSSQSVFFKLSDSSELAFYVQNHSYGDELLISSIFSEKISSLELPYSVTKNARITHKGNSDLTVLFSNHKYTFDRNILDTSRELISFDNKNPLIACRILPEETELNPTQFIISGAIDKSRYREAIALWSDKIYQSWNRSIANSNDEELITAYLAEAARRKNYEFGLSRIPERFISNSGHSFLPSPFIGGLSSSLRSMSLFEQKTRGTIEDNIKHNPSRLFEEYKVFEYLILKNPDNLLDEALSSVNTLSLESLGPHLLAGIFEGASAVHLWHGGTENPFDMLINQARLLVLASLEKDADNSHMFFTQDGDVDILLNIRLGAAIIAYGNAYADDEWGGIGRSLVLSALSFADEAGALPAALHTVNNSFIEKDGGSKLAGAEIYFLLELSDYYPHTVSAKDAMPGVYLWTASPHIGVSYKNNVLEFDVAFPVNNAHYFIVRGLRPFKKIQIRGMDYRSDPQFERYNSPGWVYRESDRTLLVKLYHREEVEFLKIFY
ncbi:MAG: hypothetical protein LBV68_07340 [Spirochaetaceae bacterium]|jgi:hypothetical protein|nr:hypothetical protein [Spirochaetaceae bacterium]